jgi:hypothetical protein
VSLDPGRYRAQIVTIDRIVYDSDAATEADRGELADQLELLAGRTSHDNASPITTALSENLRALAAGVRKRPLPQVRRGGLAVEWERIRGSLFADAPWWRHSSADPVAAIEPDRPHSHTPAALRFEESQLEITVRDLEDVVDYGQREIGVQSDMAEPRSMSAQDIARQKIVRDWASRIERAAQELPAAPTSLGDSNFAGAHHETQEAIKCLRNGASMSYGAGRMQWTAEAARHLREARGYLNAMAL